MARAFAERRAELGMSREEVAEKASLSVDAIKSIETMQDRSYRPQTKRSLEAAIQWEPGSFDDVLRKVAPPRKLSTSPANGSEGSFDPMTASHAELGVHADWMSETSNDPEVGARWLAGVLRKRLEVDRSRDERRDGNRHAM